MIKRNLIPGSEWLYCKFYTGVKSSDRILVEYIRPFVEKLKVSGEITASFFIRYNDPEFHLRLRLKVAGPDAFNGIMRELTAFFEEARETELIRRIQLDTYSRELERYGEDSMEIIENFFCEDSTSQLNLISALRENGDSDRERWLAALVLLDDLLEFFDYSLEQKNESIAMTGEAFKREFGIVSQKMERPLNDKYRAHRKQIENTLARGAVYAAYENLFQERKQWMKPVAIKLREITAGKRLGVDELIPSLMHMCINRLFRSNNRLCEMILYHFLGKYYTSRIAMLKYNPGEKNE